VPFYEYPIESLRDIPVEIGLATAGTLCLTLAQPPPREALVSGPPTRAWFDIQALRFPLVIRNLRPGDRMAPLGMQGRRQKVKAVLINAKTPSSIRRRLPLLVHSQDDILWIGGVRRSREALITASTRQALRVDWIVEGTDLWPLSGPG
jgi:tRNA(Ile)-lysidine synthase